MYGDVRKAGEVTLKVLEFGVPIPYETINDPVIMKKIRTMARFNPDMPGAIELVHPNKFLPSTSISILSFYRFASCGRIPPHPNHPDLREGLS